MFMGSWSSWVEKSEKEKKGRLVNSDTVFRVLWLVFGGRGVLVFLCLRKGEKGKGSLLI